MNIHDKAECTVCGESGLVVELQLRSTYASLNDFHQLRICIGCMRKASDSLNDHCTQRVNVAMAKLEALTRGNR